MAMAILRLGTYMNSSICSYSTKKYHIQVFYRKKFFSRSTSTDTGLDNDKNFLRLFTGRQLIKRSSTDLLLAELKVQTSVKRIIDRRFSIEKKYHRPALERRSIFINRRPFKDRRPFKSFDSDNNFFRPFTGRQLIKKTSTELLYSKFQITISVKRKMGRRSFKGRNIKTLLKREDL